VPDPIDQPIGRGLLGAAAHGSEVALDLLRLLGVEYASLLPGASFRGIHDSAVNYTLNRRPEIILCNHEFPHPRE